MPPRHKLDEHLYQRLANANLRLSEKLKKNLMSFILAVSKIFIFFLSPFYWIILILIWRKFAISRVVKKRLAITAVVIFILFSNEYIFTQVIKAWQPQPVNVERRTFSAGIILGGFSTFDRFGRGYFNNSSDRFIQARKLYHMGVIKKVIVSGGSLWRNEPSEAGFVASELIKSGVRPEDIITELNSRNTYENAKFSKLIMDSISLSQPVLLITSAQHLPRAIKLFESAGLQVEGYPCDYRVIDRKMNADDVLLPKIDILDKWGNFLKEITGLLVYKLAGKA